MSKNNISDKYSMITRNKVVKYVSMHNAKYGKGGITSAAKKFNIHTNTVSKYYHEGISSKDIENAIKSVLKTTRANSNSKITKTVSKYENCKKELDRAKKNIMEIINAQKIS